MTKKIIALFIAMLMLTSVIYCPVLADEDKLIITDCDTTDGWVNTGGTAVGTNVNGYGTNTAIHRQVMYGATRLLTYNLPEALDISPYTSVEFDVMFYSQAKTGRYDGQMWEQILEAYQSEIYLKLISEGGNDRIYRIGKLNPVISTTNTNWVHFTANIDNYNTDRSFDPSKLTGFYFSTVDGAVNTNVVDGFIRFDNIFATHPKSSGGEVEVPEEPEDESVVLSDCQELDNWTYRGNSAESDGNVNKNANGQQNSGCISVYTGFGALRKLTYTAPSAINLSNHRRIAFDLQIVKAKDATAIWEDVLNAYQSYMGIEIGDGTNTVKMTYDKMDIMPLGNEWYRFSVTVPQSASVDMTKFTTLSVYMQPGSPLDNNIADTLYKIDDVIAHKDDGTGYAGDPEGVWSIPGSFSKTATTGKFAYIQDGFSLDLSGNQKSDLYLTMDVYVENNDGSEDVSGFTSDGQIELTSSGKSDVNEIFTSVPKLNLKSGWNNIRLILSSFTVVNNNDIDLSNVNYFRFYSIAGDDNLYDVKIENVKLTNIKETSIVSTYFSNGMMFQQNKPMKVFGNIGTANVAITATLKSKGSVLQTVNTTSATSGKFEFEFDSREGGYTTYSIEISANGEVQKTISDIVVGELWLAAGQSNMEYFLGQTVPNYDFSLLPLNKNVRIFSEPTVPGGVSSVLPATPATDIEGAYWVDGSTVTNIKFTSAIAYFTCNEMQKKLDMPVGFLCTPKGASVIESWLSREAIESNEIVKAKLKSRNLYYTESQLGTIASNWTKMTTLYNTKIAPLAGINIAGMMWYQGEGNIKYAETNGDNTFYENALSALTESWGTIFGFESGKMPVVIAHLAPYNYSTVRASDYDTILPKFSEALNNVWSAQKANAVQIPIYDLSLEYRDPPSKDFDPIHPSHKADVAERFSAAILGRFYGVGGSDINAPIFKSYTISGNKVIVKLDCVGTGLKILGGDSSLEGFTIAGSDRKFVNAYAKIVGKDTVEIYSPMVSSPVAAAYAFTSFNTNANLCNSYDFPAVPFRTDKVDSTFLTEHDWMNAEHETVWVDSRKTNTAGFENTWNVSSGSATLTFDNTTKAEGNSSLKVVAAENSGISPVLNFATMNNILANYKYLSVKIKNASSEAKTISLKISTSYAPDLNGNIRPTLEADSGFTTLTFDISSLKNTTGADISASQIKTALSTKVLSFSVPAGTYYIDDIRFGNEVPSAIVSEEKISTGVSVSNIASNLGLSSNAVVYNANGTKVTSGYVGTGFTVVDGNTTIEIVVQGDLNGDASSDSSDLALLVNHLLQKQSLTGSYLKAADYSNSNSSITIKDLVKMKKALSK